MTPIPKPTKKVKVRRGLKRGKRIRRGPTKEGRAFWHALRMEVLARSGGRCENSEVIVRSRPTENPNIIIADEFWFRCSFCFGRNGEGMDVAHRVPLGRGRSRYKPHPLNRVENLMGLCRHHHEQVERERLAEAARSKGI